MKKKLLIISAIALLATSCVKTTPNSSNVESSFEQSSSDYSSLESISSSENITSSELSSSESEITSSSSSSFSSNSFDETNYIFEGVNNSTISKGRYFHVLDGIKVHDKNNNDLMNLLSIEGSVDYGVEGDYYLNYKLNIDGHTITKTRKVTVTNTSITNPSYPAKDITNGKTTLGSGSCRSGNGEDLQKPANPTYIDERLAQNAIPTNGWWTSLIFNNYGNNAGIYFNPLRASFSKDGLTISNPGEGNSEFYVGGDTTSAHYSVQNQELVLKNSTLSSSYETRVIDYSDNSVKVAMRNDRYGADIMVATFAQGSPFAFIESSTKSGISFDIGTGRYGTNYFYDLEGNEIQGSYRGESIVIKIPSSYRGNLRYPDGTIGDPQYDDKYYLISTPTKTTFSVENTKLSLSLGSGNYFSIAPTNSVEEAKAIHNYSYSFVAKEQTEFTVDHDKSVVKTLFTTTNQFVRPELNKENLTYLMPHQWKYSKNELTNISLKSMHGALKLLKGQQFLTEQDFNGMLPTFAKPTDSSFSSDVVQGYLNTLYNQIASNSDTEPYFHGGKTLYPAAQGAIMADQIGNTALRDKFIAKLKDFLADWFTYSGTSDSRYLYHNKVWGTTYYNNSNFGTATELNDHHFTHGYIIYAAAVVGMFDKAFYDSYHEMALYLLRDYMNENRENTAYPYLRNYDPWAGHSWASGHGSFFEGNNQESSGEALNSWVAGYLLGVQDGNQEITDTAIYGFVSELNSLKQYIFDYDQENFSEIYSSYAPVSGMVWGGKYTFATWFGANPEFIYGIHYLPIGEYVSSYLIGDRDRASLSRIYKVYEKLSNNHAKEVWVSNMLVVESLFDPSSALARFDANRISTSDYPKELSTAYWSVHANNSVGNHTNNAYMKINSNIASSIYEKNGNMIGEVWNPSNTAQTVEIYSKDNRLLKTEVVNPNSFVSISIN